MMFPFFRGRSQKSKNTKRQLPERMPLGRRRLRLESLEDRSMLSAISVTSLNDAGAGSLRAAITTADQSSGETTIDFAVSGTIHLSSAALPAITADVEIVGSSAPGFAGTPNVEINFDGFAGLQFNAGATDAALESLSLVGAAGTAVTITTATDVVLEGNYIGLNTDGSTVDGNSGGGITITNSSGDTIGGTSASDRNVISGNGGNGINLNGVSTTLIAANYIGTDSSGALARANVGNGISLQDASVNNTIGGTVANVISANDDDGVLISNNSD
jgi:hypothetical protein